MSAHPFIVMLNPKTLEIVQVFKQDRGRGNAGYRMSLLSAPRVCIANCWTDGSERAEVGNSTFVRIHSAGYCSPRDAADFGPNLDGVSDGYKGQGYGMLVYAAAAVGTKQESRFAGVFSPTSGPNHNRSRDADALWKSMVEKDLAEEEEIEGEEEEEEDTMEHCESISSGTYADSDEEWLIIDRKVCGDVNVVKNSLGEDIQVNVLRAGVVLAQSFVLWTDAGGEQEGPPADLLVRAHVANPKMISTIVNRLREEDDGQALVEAFVSRPDVAAILGQQSLFGAFGAHRRVALPPVSRETRRLLDLFDHMP